MMRRMWVVFTRDLKASLRDPAVMYGLLAMLVIAVILRAIIPDVGATTVNLVVPADLDAATVEALRDYGKVEIVADLAAVESRVRGWDDAVGIVPRGGSYQLILQGNETEATKELSALILADIHRAAPDVEVVHRDLGHTASPLLLLISTIMPLSGMLIGGLVIGFATIEEKESNVTSALGTTPLGNLEYLGGRSLLAIVLSLVIALSTLLIMGVWPFDIFKVTVITLVGTGLVIVAGLYIGGVAGNQIEAIGILKLIALPFTLTPLLVWVLPETWHPALYWLGPYWTAMAYRTTLETGGTWAQVLMLIGIGFGVTLVTLALTYNMIRRRLLLRT